MKHIFSNIFNQDKYLKSDKYYRLWYNLGWIWAAVAILLLILRLSIPDIRDYLFQGFVVTFIAILLTTVVFFIIRIVKAKVIDWSHVAFSALMLWLIWAMIDEHGGLSAVFSAT